MSKLSKPTSSSKLNVIFCTSSRAAKTNRHTNPEPSDPSPSTSFAKIMYKTPRRIHKEAYYPPLTPSGALLGHLPLLGLLLLLQELLLLVGVHLAESAVALLLLELLGLHAALLGLLFVVELAQLAGLVFAGGADLAQGFGAEVRGVDEVVGHAQESGEEGG